MYNHFSFDTNVDGLEKIKIFNKIMNNFACNDEVLILSIMYYQLNILYLFSLLLRKNRRTRKPMEQATDTWHKMVTRLQTDIQKPRKNDKNMYIVLQFKLMTIVSELFSFYSKIFLLWNYEFYHNIFTSVLETKKVFWYFFFFTCLQILICFSTW